MDFAVVPFVESVGHTIDDACSAVVQHNQCAGGRIDTQSFYLSGTAEDIHRHEQRHVDLAVQVVVGKRIAEIQVIRFAFVGIAVITRNKETSVSPQEDALLMGWS